MAALHDNMPVRTDKRGWLMYVSLLELRPQLLEIAFLGTKSDIVLVVLRGVGYIL